MLEYLPEQYQICLTARYYNKTAFEILQNTHDNKEKLQAFGSIQRHSIWLR